MLHRRREHVFRITTAGRDPAGKDKTMAKFATKTELGRIARCALEYEYGFCPALKDITLLEASDDRTYILFNVNGHEYSFRSRLVWDGVVWCGPGTIEKLEPRKNGRP